MNNKHTGRRIGLKIICLGLFLSALHSPGAFAQTAKEIISKHIKAIGGQQKIDAVNSYSFQTSSRTIYYKKPGRWRIDHTEGDKIVQTQIYHGEKGWTIYKSGDAESAFSGMDFQSFLMGLLVFAKPPDYKVEYLGPDTESDNLLIKITSLVNNTSGYYSFTYYINPATYLITKMREGLSGTSYMIYFEDYTLVNGIQIPLKTARINDDSKQKIVETKINIKVNPALDDKLFLKPALKKQVVAFVGSTGKYGYRDENFITVIKPKYDDAWSFNETGFAKVKLNNLFGFINIKGQEVIPLKYTDVQGFYEGLSGVQADKKWGFIDSTGKMIIPTIYEKAQIFKAGLAGVSLGGKWGFIDKKGTVVIPLEYDFISFFKDGKVSVKKDGATYSIDKAGKKTD